MVKKIFIISMVFLFCYSIFLTGCGSGTDRTQTENSTGQADSAVNPETTSSGTSSGDVSPATEVSGEPGEAVSSEATGSQAATTVDSGQGATNKQTSPDTAVNPETTVEKGSQGTGTKPETASEQTSNGTGVNQETTSGQLSQGTGENTASNNGQGSEVVKHDYYLAGSFNGYVANDPNFKMKPVPGNETWYTFTVVLTENNRDELYDGHWYKVTTGNWNDPSYGIDNYCIKNPPIKYLDDGTPIGLGSIWVDENIELTVMFDSVNKIVYDNANGKSLPTP